MVWIYPREKRIETVIKALARIGEKEKQMDLY
jgi:hypothetical protein